MVKQIFNFLIEEGFILKKYYTEKRRDNRFKNDSVIYKIVLNGKKNLKLWLKLINFRNSRHLKKIKKMGPAEFESAI
ncbi:MAG: hypothetical protein ABIJ08_07315 [Nanoarchaeota archaeon]